MTDPATPPPIAPGVTMKAHEALAARVDTLEAELKELKAFAASAKALMEVKPKKGGFFTWE